jgi:hypothetical protein
MTEEDKMAMARALNLAAANDRQAADMEVKTQEALLASLPPLLSGLALSAFLLGHVPLSQVLLGGPTPYLVTEPSFTPLFAPGLIGLLLVGGGLLGSWRRLPRWSYTWTTGSVVVVVLSLVLLGQELPYLVSPAMDVVIILGLLAIVAAVAVIAAWRGSLDAGLVGLGFASTFAVAVTFGATAGPLSRIDVGLFSTPAGLLCAVLIVAYLRGSMSVKRASIALTAMLAAALIWSYRAIIFVNMPAFSDNSFHWRLLAMATAGLLGPPLLTRFLDLRRPVEAA